MKKDFETLDKQYQNIKKEGLTGKKAVRHLMSSHGWTLKDFINIFETREVMGNYFGF